MRKHVTRKGERVSASFRDPSSLSLSLSFSLCVTSISLFGCGVVVNDDGGDVDDGDDDTEFRHGRLSSSTLCDLRLDDGL